METTETDFTTLLPLVASFIGCALAFYILGWLSRKWIVNEDMGKLRRKNLELAGESAELVVAKDELRGQSQRLHELEVEVALAGETRSILEKRLRETESRLSQVLRDREAENSRINSHLAEISVLKAILTERDSHIETQDRKFREAEEARRATELRLHDLDDRLQAELQAKLAAQSRLAAIENRPQAPVTAEPSSELRRLEERLAEAESNLAEAEQSFRVLIEEKKAEIAALEKDNLELIEVRGGFFEAMLAEKDAIITELRAQVGQLEAEVEQMANQLRMGHAGALRAGAAGFSTSTSGRSLVVAPGADSTLRPPADPLTPAELAGRLESLLFDQRIEFTPHTAQMAEGGTASLLIEIAELLVRCPEASIRLEGHTDSSGDANSNWQLSHARAYAVRDYLVDCGLPLHRFTCVGYGDTRAIDENQTEDGRWRNRRVEVRVIPPR